MTRILQAMAGARHGGAEAFFERLAIGLHHAGVQQRVVIRRDKDRAELLRDAGVDVVELAFGGMFDLRTRPALKCEIADFAPQVVLSWMNRATNFTPKGSFVHAARLGGYYDLKYYQQCDHLIGNTRGIVTYILDKGWSKDRVHYLPNFVSTEHGTAITRSMFDVPQDAKIALALGRLHTNKGFDVLLAAMAKAPEFHLLLAGEGPERDALKQLAHDLKIEERVNFLGWRSDIANLLASVDLFVCSSRHEPLGNVVIEAWAAGVPVVSANSEGPSELIDNGVNGLLVKKEKADELAAAMRKVVGDNGLREQLITEGRKSYDSSFSEAHVVELYREFFDKVAR